MCEAEYDKLVRAHRLPDPALYDAGTLETTTELAAFFGGTRTPMSTGRPSRTSSYVGGFEVLRRCFELGDPVEAVVGVGADYVCVLTADGRQLDDIQIDEGDAEFERRVAQAIADARLRSRDVAWEVVRSWNWRLPDPQAEAGESRHLWEPQVGEPADHEGLAGFVRDSLHGLTGQEPEEYGRGRFRYGSGRSRDRSAGDGGCTFPPSGFTTVSWMFPKSRVHASSISQTRCMAAPARWAHTGGWVTSTCGRSKCSGPPASMRRSFTTTFGPFLLSQGTGRPRSGHASTEVGLRRPPETQNQQAGREPARLSVVSCRLPSALEREQRRMTEDDLDWWLTVAGQLNWMIARTYAETAPHSYVVHPRTAGMTKDDYARAAHVIHTFGQPGKFYNMTSIYLTSPDGRRSGGP